MNTSHLAYLEIEIIRLGGLYSSCSGIRATGEPFRNICQTKVICGLLARSSRKGNRRSRCGTVEDEEGSWEWEAKWKQEEYLH